MSQIIIGVMDQSAIEHKIQDKSSWCQRFKGFKLKNKWKRKSIWSYFCDQTCMHDFIVKT